MDLNQDGYQDIIAGQYHPGDIIWFRGSAKGFLPGVKLDQAGDSSSRGQPDYGDYDGERGDIGTYSYWTYSVASAGDFTGDGLADLIVGGNVLRLSENIGTKDKPKFAERKPLLDLDGNPLMTEVWNEADIAKQREQWGDDWDPALHRFTKVQSDVVDWDGDGVLDILATNHYTSDRALAVTFFKGVKTKAGHRFHKGVDLLATKNGVKALPGSGARVHVADWNKDGVLDLIIGASVATIDGKFSDDLSWEWEMVNQVESAGKDPGRYPKDEPRLQPVQTVEEYIAQSKKWNPDASDEELRKSHAQNVKFVKEMNKKEVEHFNKGWHKMIHQGRVYVLLGEESGK